MCTTTDATAVDVSKRAEISLNILNRCNTTQLDIVGAGHRPATRIAIRIQLKLVICS